MTFLIHAPGLGHNTMDEMAAFGAAMWLGMQAKRSRELQLDQCTQFFLDPHLAKSYLLLASTSTQGYIPLLWLAYARFSPQCEAKYIQDPDAPLVPNEWNSGDRLWFLHLAAQGNLSPSVKSTLRSLFSRQTARSLSPRSHIRGPAVMVWRGDQVSPSQAHTFWAQRPILRD
jgi:hemolysin-activating ACP:hemolysin acyltransferase